MLTTIPFQGFYQSIHDEELNDALNQAFTDHKTGCDVNFDMVNHVSQKCNWSYAFLDYAKAYTVNFASKFSIKMVFESLTSPKAYNFETDRIFCEIELSEVERIFAAINKDDLKAALIENFTSCSGFISNYSNDLDSWGEVATWDHNQVGTLIACYAIQESNSEFYETDLMETDKGNGRLINWIENATDNIERFYKIFDYLETRKTR